MKNKYKILSTELLLRKFKQLNSRKSMRIILYGLDLKVISKKKSINNSIKMYSKIQVIPYLGLISQPKDRLNLLDSSIYQKELLMTNSKTSMRRNRK